MSKEGETMGKSDETDCNIIHKDVVDEVTAKMPMNSIFQKSSDFFKVLGDETRTKILWVLDQHEMCVLRYRFCSWNDQIRHITSACHS